jgi:aerobic-type carbon monoxide dehydrogenase small subunit (CoxS/CutS family)
MKTMQIRLKVNGEPKQWNIAPGDLLLDVLRRENYFGVKRGCETGECGACTVLVNGKAINSCLMFAAQAEGCQILTIEGVAQGDALDPLQEAFLEHGAVQCGFCTPGMILNAKALLARRPNPTEEEVRDMLAGNFCRCTGYHKVIQAVLAVAPPFRAARARPVAARAGLKSGATAANGRDSARRRKSTRRAGAATR